MYLKADGGKKASSSKKIVIVILILFLAAVVVIGGIKLVQEIRFRMSLPDPDAATEMSVRRYEGNTVVFRCGDYGVAGLGEFQPFAHAVAFGHLDALFVETADDSFHKGWGDDPYNFGTIDKIYVAAGADEAFIEDITEYFYDSEIIQLKKKGEKFVAGEMVVRVLSVYGEEIEGENGEEFLGGIAFSVTHGHNTYLVSNDNYTVLKPYRNKRFDVAFAPIRGGEQLENVKYYVCQVGEGSAGTPEEMSSICEQFLEPERRDIYGICDGKDVYFDATFVVTGRIPE